MKQQTANPLEVTAEEAAARACPDHPLIDIRSQTERQLGAPAGAVAMAAEDLLGACAGNRRLRDRGGFVLCSRGVSSLELVQRLRDTGVGSFRSVLGGFRAWQAAGLPVGYPAGLNAQQAERYARHLVMPQIGPEGQARLLETRILLAGLGGLNSPAALYLAAAGVGTLGLADFDIVERSNLQRQVVHGEDRLGMKKTESVRRQIENINPDVSTEILDIVIDGGNARDLVAHWDIVVDGTDSFAARYALNEACIDRARPLVYGAVMRFQGQVSVFWPTRPDGGHASSPCFQCLVPGEPDPAAAPSCSEAGVLGVLPGIIGCLQANEALKLALGIGQPLTGRLLLVDALNLEFRQTRLAARPGCPACGA
jgi:molybdopterin/thiamine biosynthesis adenylyltransferase/rhodanese-related sulfurtransferase